MILKNQDSKTLAWTYASEQESWSAIYISFVAVSIENQTDLCQNFVDICHISFLNTIPHWYSASTNLSCFGSSLYHRQLIRASTFTLSVFTPVYQYRVPKGGITTCCPLLSRQPCFYSHSGTVSPVRRVIRLQVSSGVRHRAHETYPLMV